MSARSINDLKIGESAASTKVMDDQEVREFADVSGDNNPIHLNDKAAAESIFGKRVVHGMLVASMFSALLGTKLPGEGTIYVGQDVKFVKPVYLGDTITATVTVSEVNPERKRCILDTLAVNQHNEPVIRGKATVLLPN